MAWCCALQPGCSRISANKFGPFPDKIPSANSFALCSARGLGITCFWFSSRIAARIPASRLLRLTQRMIPTPTTTIRESGEGKREA
jgi:hypothetical protein